jgi:hypothetical protein
MHLNAEKPHAERHGASFPSCFGPTHRRGFERTLARDLPFIGSLLRHELQALVGPTSRHGMAGRTGLRLWQIKRIALAPNENSSLLKVGEELLLFVVGVTGLELCGNGFLRLNSSFKQTQKQIERTHNAAHENHGSQDNFQKKTGGERHRMDSEKASGPFKK